MSLLRSSQNTCTLCSHYAIAATRLAFSITTVRDILVSYRYRRKEDKMKTFKIAYKPRRNNIIIANRDSLQNLAPLGLNFAVDD